MYCNVMWKLIAVGDGESGWARALGCGKVNEKAMEGGSNRSDCQKVVLNNVIILGMNQPRLTIRLAICQILR